jgi:thymidylate kinase
MVGPLVLVTEPQILESLTDQNRLSKLPFIADILLRPIGRGNHVSAERLKAARDAWGGLHEHEKEHCRQVLVAHLGRGADDLVEALLTRTNVDRVLRDHMWRRTLRIIFSKGTAFRVAASKYFFDCASRITGRTKPFGRFHMGLIVVMNGTDGAGKSSTLVGVRSVLDDQQMKACVHYLGRGRENFPGIAKIRDLVGSKIKATDHHRGDVYKYSYLNKAASWLYALDYHVRCARVFMDARLFGKIVLCDRYVYDIGLIPGHSATAMRFARAICPRPDINVLLYARPEVIQARKCERDRETIEKHQSYFKNVIEAKYARFSSLDICTEKNSLEQVCAQIAKEINQACHPKYG